jgi:RNA polymerase sigma-70 factor, ECF subfamily
MAMLVRSTAAKQALDIDRLFREHARYVARIGLRLLGRHSEVDDLVQDVFLDALRGAHTLREPGAARGWLAVIAVRKASAQLRRRRLWRRLGLDRAPDYDEVTDHSASPRQRQLLASVYRALDRLPVDERVAWSLRHLEGERLEAIAELCYCSMSTVKRRIDSAARQIRELVEP